MRTDSKWPRFTFWRNVRRSRPRTLVRYGAICAALLGPASALDVVAGGELVTPMTIAWAFAIGVGAGLLLGIGLGLLFRLLSKLPAWASTLVWLGAGGLVSAWMIDELNVISLLDTRERQLAIGALAASVMLGVGFFATALILQPRPLHPQGWVGHLRTRHRVPWVLGLLVIAAGAIYADRTQFVGTYPSAHQALRWAGFLGGMTALVALVPRLRPSPLVAGVGTVGAIGLVVFPFITIKQTHYSELSAMLEQPYSRIAIKLVRNVGDPDFDGYSMFLGGGDCAPFNRKVNPGAAEIPGNGIDDNCRWGDAVRRAGVTDPATVPIPDKPSPMSVVLITVDTVRADRLSVYGAQRDTTPGIKAWADKKAIRFNKAMTSGGWTSLALSSLFRGVYPRRLTWTKLYETTKYRLLRAPVEDQLLPGEKAKKQFGMPLESELRKPLAWWLQRRGMQTVAVTDDGFSEFLSPENGVDAGFDVFSEVDDLPKAQQEDKGTADEAIRQLQALSGDKPFFMWVHFFGPHNPSKVHAGTKKWGESAMDKYDHELRYADEQVTRLIKAIEDEQKSRKVAIILTADHGESIQGAGRNHGGNVSEGIIHIPLILSVPGVKARTSDKVVSLVDIMPTVLALTETPPPPELDGRDLREIMADPDGIPRVVFSETWQYGQDGEPRSDQIAASDGEYKLEWNLDNEAKKLWRRSDKDKARKPNLLGEVDVPHLEDALNTYLEENGNVKLVD